MTHQKVEQTRRDFIRTASVGVGAIALVGTANAASPNSPLRETADLIVGPFYPQQKPIETDFDMINIASHGRQAAGQVVRLRGRLFNSNGKPLANRKIAVWQANANGRYSHPSDPNVKLPLDANFQGYAAVSTDRGGRYAITTIRPGPYRTPRGDMRAPHIHFEIHGAVDRKTTQLFFPGEPLNQQDRHLNSVRRPDTVMAKISSLPADSVWVAEWDIVLTNG